MYAPGSACLQLCGCCRSGAALWAFWDMLAGAQSRPGGQQGNQPHGAVQPPAASGQVSRIQGATSFSLL